ncbi:MAG: CoA-binding protein [Acidimicrobiia bacterium]|nr:CoA-binding protein [Acidimicrobiia bacterium]
MTDFLELLAAPDTTVAVVGASDNMAKYGAIIYRDLKARGFPVFPVNPNRTTVDGDPAYPNLATLPEEPTIIDMVIPADIGLSVLEEADRLGYRRVWFQPGSESAELLRYAQERGFDLLHDACIMVVAGSVGRLKTPPRFLA